MPPGAADQSKQGNVAKLDGADGLHDAMANPEIYKHVQITQQLASLLGTANAEQVDLAAANPTGILDAAASLS